MDDVISKHGQVRIGLKLWTTDTHLLEESQHCFANGVYDYIELYVIPGTFNQTSTAWNSGNVPIIIHAPHSGHGVNLADRSLRKNNQTVYDEVKRYADLLASPHIIVHPGNNGELDEIINQLLLINDERICLENKPVRGISGETCLGSVPAEIEKILSATRLKGFVLDFGHAAYASRTVGCNLFEMIVDLMEFNPLLFHLADGSLTSEKDMHLNLGEGNLPLSCLLSFVVGDCMVTLETPRHSESGLDDFADDVLFLRTLLSSKKKDITFRKATLDDRALLLAWRNAPMTRKASHQSHVISVQEHNQWLRATLSCSSRKLYIALTRGVPVGTVRVDLVDGVYELSWTVAPEKNGQGIGKQMIYQLASLIADPIKAEIKADNKASVKIAEHAGMRLAFEENSVLHYSRGRIDNKDKSLTSEIVSEPIN